MRLEDYPKDPRFDATVLKSERITDEDADVEVRELVLEVDRKDFDFDIGQSIGVLVEGPKEFGGAVHHRLYTVADTPTGEGKDKPEITIVVKRCNYIDDYSGEEYAGVNSNYLCDRRPGDKLSITGPFGLPFTVGSLPGARVKPRAPTRAMESTDAVMRRPLCVLFNMCLFSEFRWAADQSSFRLRLLAEVAYSGSTFCTASDHR